MSVCSRDDDPWRVCGESSTGATPVAVGGPACATPKSRKPKIARVPVVVRGQYPNHVWAIDFQFNETTGGRPVKI